MTPPAVSCHTGQVSFVMELTEQAGGM